MDKEHSWIESGYRTFAYEGPQGLKVEKMARAVKKNKSSFYHFFADLEVFTERLLQYHLKQGRILAEKESRAENERDLALILVEHKIDLLFNHQLRVHRENPAFEKCFQEINTISIPAIVPVWKRLIGLEDNSHLAEMVLRLSLENFFLQLTDETVNEEWLTGYIRDFKVLVTQFQNTQINKELDASV